MVLSRRAAPPGKHLLLLGTFVHSRTAQELDFMHDAAVAVGRQGTIVAMDRGSGDVRSAGARLVARLGWRPDDVDVVACDDGQFFFPGFIDTHIHAPQYANAGIFGKSTLLDWLDRYTFPLESSLCDLDRARRVYTACVRRTLAHGTTTAAYFATNDVASTNLLADVCLGLGQRALVGRVCMDRPGFCPDYYRDESPEAAIEATLECIAHIKSIDPDYETLTPILTPRFVPACTSDAMLGLAEVQRQTGLPVQTHVSENTDEKGLVAQLYPEAASYTAVYDEHGLLTPRTILAHAVHISEDEARLIAARAAKVSHCPCSNSSLTSGEARVRWMWDRGIDVGLGTDMSGGYSPSILEAARQATLASRHLAMGIDDRAERERGKLTVDEALYLATKGGASVVGLEAKVGAFEVGMRWDAQLVGLGSVRDDGTRDGETRNGAAAGWDDTGNVDVFGWETWDERVAKWLYNGDDRNTKMVWVNGRLVHARR